MKKDYSNILLGYRDYNDDEKYGKDFPTLDSVVAWICEVITRDAEITSEFVDFILQEYSTTQLIRAVEDYTERMWPNKGEGYNFEEEIKMLIESRSGGSIVMHAAEFEEAKIPQKKD